MGYDVETHFCEVILTRIDKRHVPLSMEFQFFEIKQTSHVWGESIIKDVFVFHKRNLVSIAILKHHLWQTAERIVEKLHGGSYRIYYRFRTFGSIGLEEILELNDNSLFPAASVMKIIKAILQEIGENSTFLKYLN